jgi:hypothetical protein
VTGRLEATGIGSHPVGMVDDRARESQDPVLDSAQHTKVGILRGVSVVL